jgi:hypothetical protein
MAAFAADLHDVMLQRGKRPIYEDPAKFFALTFPTVNLRQLAKDVVLRLRRENQKAVRQLELTYGGGKTHSLITLFHLARDPKKLSDIPAVREFKHEIGAELAQARVACLPFDHIDDKTGAEVPSPDGTVRRLRYPWSILAWQIAGEEGLRILNAGESADERDTPPATNIVETLLSFPAKDGIATLILLDEVLMYVRQVARTDSGWVDIMKNFFQYLTQAATKVDSCCVIASLLASEVAGYDEFGKRIQRELYDIFAREREAAVEPVQKGDVAEVLKRRFFTLESVKDKDAFRPHVITVRKALETLDEQSKQNPAKLEEDLLASYPFHPRLTDVLYENWTHLQQFQRARGILRTFALALREAHKSGQTAPLVGPSVFLRGAGEGGIGDALRELVIVADAQPSEGQKTAWMGILEGELSRALQIQDESLGLKNREVEQAVIATFLYSQPIGQEARLRDLVMLVGPTAPDRIELEKGLIRWAQESHWLDDRYSTTDGTKVPQVWRMGNRPNLKQMHEVARKHLSVKTDIIEARLIDEIDDCKRLTEGGKGSGAHLSIMPKKPSDLSDDGAFHFVILGPKAASESGKPSTEARRFLDETSGPDKPRVFRNSIVAVAPSKDGVDLARSRVLDLLAWEQVAAELDQGIKKGEIESSRLHTLTSNVDTARQRVPDAIRHAYCIVVTVAEDDTDQAFKINVSDEPLFITVKNDKRSRVEETAITAEALLPDGPYDLWHQGETERRVKDLVGAFAQLPKLPKMLNAKAIFETLLTGCEEGAFVLRLPRPDHSFRSWWRSRPDDAAMADPAMEVVLTEHATLTELTPQILSPDRLPGLWQNGRMTMQDVTDYFSGSKVIQISRGEYQEPQRVPKADSKVLETAVNGAVKQGLVWVVSGPASLWNEEVPPGILGPAAELLSPPQPIAATALLPELIPSAWAGNETSALALATALAQQAGRTLPWRLVSTAIDNALKSNFIELTSAPSTWPCISAGAAQATFSLRVGGGEGGGRGEGFRESQITHALAEYTAAQLQDFVEELDHLLSTAAAAGLTVGFMLDIRVGTEDKHPDAQTLAKLQEILTKVNSTAKFETRYKVR